MKKLLQSLPFFLFFFFLSTLPTLAFTLDSIGSSTVTSQTFSDWYYTAQNPLLSGTAAASSTVNITIDGTAYTSTADTSGNWSYTPTTLTNGDRNITLTGDGTTLSFTLHVGQSVPSGTSTASSSGTLPVSGSLSQTLILLGLGAGIITAGFALKPKTI